MVDEQGSLRRRAAGWLCHPITVILLVGLVTTALNIWWVRGNRHVGNYNVDEVGYMARALVDHSNFDPLHPLLSLKTIAAPSSTGPLVPLLAVPFIALFGRDISSVMLIQPLLVLGTALGVTGILLQVASRRAAVVAGVITLCLPAMVQSARGFQYATAAAAFLSAAVWALLRSDRGSRRLPMIAFGLATGLMLLSRTMAIGMLPALAVATLIQARRDRRAWINVGFATATTVLIAGPWWLISRNALFDYLFSFGYGDNSQYYGDSSLRGRVSLRWSDVVDDTRVLRWVGMAAVAVAVGTATVRVLRRRAGQRADPGKAPPPSSTLTRLLDDPLSTLGAVVLVGFLTLLTTRNRGVWFELPVEVLLVSLLVGLAARFPTPVRTLFGVAAVVLSAVTFAVSLTDSGGQGGVDQTSRSRLQRAQSVLYGALIDRERPLTDVDAALGSDDPSVRANAATRWWRANLATAKAIERLRRSGDGPLHVTVSGNSHLLNGQSLLLAQELLGVLPPPADVPVTTGSVEELHHLLESVRRAPDRQVVVIIRSRSLPFPEDRHAQALLTVAEADGWQRIERIGLPNGGEVLLLIPPVPCRERGSSATSPRQPGPACPGSR